MLKNFVFSKNDYICNIKKTIKTYDYGTNLQNYNFYNK